jgi:hypothetical protein
VLPHLTFAESKRSTRDSAFYLPVAYFDSFWKLSADDVQVNATTTAVNVTVEFGGPISLMSWLLQQQLEEGWNKPDAASRLMQGADAQASSESIDTMKRMLKDTNPYLLAVTAIVTLFHSVFDFLAFKNDISFFRENKSTVGISVRGIALNCICQLIVLLYLQNNDTPFMVLISTLIGFAIEVWKLVKNVKITKSSAFPYVSIAAKISGDNGGDDDADKAPMTAAATAKAAQERESAEYDRQAMTYLSWILFPLVLCYAAYSLVYETHKSWYAFILSALVGSVYTFGFVMMTPQLYLYVARLLL